MRKTLEGIALLFLICFSFFYTDKVINVINKNDPLMVEIVKVKSDYDVFPVNAIINDNTIIPGVNGREIDVEKSYNNMRLSGVFRENALIFKSLYPDEMLSMNKNKYIVRGNPIKKEVAIVCLLNVKYIDKINQIDNITIFINHSDLNLNNIKKLKNKEIYSYGNNGLYNEETLMNDNVLINRMTNNKVNYCLLKEKNDDILNICNDNNMYVIIPNIVGNYYEVKNNLSNGSIIFIQNLNDIDSIIKYTLSKGYSIVTLSKLLNE